MSALQYIALGTDIVNSALLDIGIVCIPKKYSWTFLWHMAELLGKLTL